MINKSELNERIISIWNTKFDDDAIAPLLFDDIKTNQLLFVGMNPSFSAKEIKNFLKGTTYDSLAHEELFRWGNIKHDPRGIDKIVEVDRFAVEHHPYFSRMRQVAKEARLDWQHFDLFFYRKTNQAEFLDGIFDGNELNPFGMSQIEIFSDALKISRPRCILVANAKASEIFRSYFSKSITWDDERGHHFLDLDDLHIPTYFSSMLTGQRALDRWSYERLKWQILRSCK